MRCASLLALLALVSCSSQRTFEVQEATVVDAAGTTVARTVGNRLAQGFELNLERTDPADGAPVLWLVVEHEGSRPFEIQPGQSLIVRSDGHVEILSSREGGAERRVQRNLRIRERARYRITDSELFAILEAEAVELELYGRWGKRRFPLRPETRANLRAFVDAELR